MKDLKEALLALIDASPNGLSISEIVSDLDMSASAKRSVQRELSHLVEKRLIIRRGKARATRYYSLDAGPESDLQITQYLKQPVERRKKVGYNYSFLHAYRPNQDYYLPLVLRETLATLGKQPDGDAPEGTYAKSIFNRFLLDLSWNSSRLEGNTYSLLDTEQLLFHNKFDASRNMVETQMILNHKSAIEFLVESASEIKINRFTIFNLHALLADNLISNPESIGRIRKIPVGIGRTTYRPLNVPQLLEVYFDEILLKADAIHDPIEQAFFLLVHIPYLQAFEDVNKRVSRLAANIPLIKHNLAPLSFIDIESSDYIDAILSVYELNKVDLLIQLFDEGYRSSVKRYKIIKDETNKPDAFKIEYRLQINTLIHDIIMGKIAKANVDKFVAQWSKDVISRENMDRFKRIIDQELVNIHEGNFARYRVRPSDFYAWYKLWKS